MHELRQGVDKLPAGHNQVPFTNWNSPKNSKPKTSECGIKAISPQQPLLLGDRTTSQEAEQKEIEAHSGPLALHCQLSCPLWALLHLFRSLKDQVLKT